MKKHFALTLGVFAAAFLLGVTPATAQGRGQGRGQGQGRGAAAGSHAPMGMNNAMSGHGAMGNSNNTMARGPKTAGELLTQNTQLASKLAPLVGCTGTNSAACLQAAATGFKNLGQFVAAAHVSQNLGIPFACLSADMTGTLPPTGAGAPTCPAGTGTKKLSLGSSIQALKPTMTGSQVKSATKTANHQAHADVHGS